MEIISFSGLSRTGKTSGVKLLADKLTNHGKKVCVYEELAQQYINTIDNENIDKYNMQKYILTKDKERLNEIYEFKKQNKYDFAIVDRTLMDGIAITYWDMINKEIEINDLFDNLSELIEFSKKVYDKVFFFDHMIEQDQLFKYYNSEEFGFIFKGTIKNTYSNIFYDLHNNIEFSKNIDFYLNKII